MSDQKEVKDITFTWKEGRYFDLWLIPHMLFGSICGFLFLFLEGNRALSYGVTFLVIAGWELIEGFAGIKETQENRVLDLVAGIAGFGLAYEIGILTLDQSAVFALLIFAIIISLILCLFGWLDFRQREKGESKLY